MEKNQNRSPQSAHTRSIAHQLEQSETVYASAYAKPPIMFENSDPLHSRNIESEELSEELTNPIRKSPIEQNAEAQLKIDQSPSVLLNKNEEKEKKDEEIKESISSEIIFADAPIEPPSDGDSGEESNAGIGSSGDDNPTVQAKLSTESSIDHGNLNTNDSSAVISKMENSDNSENDNIELSQNPHSTEKSNDTVAGHNLNSPMNDHSAQSIQHHPKQLKTNPNVAQLSEEDEEGEYELTEVPDDAIIKKGTTTFEYADNNYEVKGKLRAVIKQISQEANNGGQKEAGSITTQFSSIDISSLSAKAAHVDLTVLITKRMPIWIDLPKVKALANDKKEKNQAYYQKVLNSWTKFYSNLDAHEEAHKAIDVDQYADAHTKLIGKTISEMDSKLNDIENEAFTKHEEYHTNHGSHETIKDVQRPYEITADKSDDDEDSVQYKMPQDHHKNSTSEKSNNSSDSSSLIQKMEESFGTSFSDVKFHKNSSQATNAGALAYAQGSDVHFAPGQFKPNTKSGQELIGHELAHVVQQRQGRVKPTIQHKGMNVNDDPNLEKEADDMGRKAANANQIDNFSSSNHINHTNSYSAPIQKVNNQSATQGTFIFDPYSFEDQQLGRDTIQAFLDRLVNDRGESLIIQFSMEASGFVQVGVIPAYVSVGLSASMAYEKMQDFTYLFSSNINFQGDFGVGRNGVAAGVSVHAGYSYQWEFGSSRAVAGSIYNFLVNMCIRIRDDENLTDEQKQELLLPMEGMDFVEAGAKKELSVVSYGGGVFAQGERELEGDRSAGGNVSATWSTSEVTHMDRQDPDAVDRRSIESVFAVEGEVNFPISWLGGAQVIVPASFAATTVVGDPNVNMNGKYRDLSIQPTLLVESAKVQELVRGWGENSGLILNTAISMVSGMAGFGDVSLSVLRRVGQAGINALPAAQGQLAELLPNEEWENSPAKLKIAPKISWKWRQQEESGQRTYELMKWSLSIQFAKVLGAEARNESSGNGFSTSVEGGTTIRLTGGIGSNTLYFIRQTFIDAPENAEGNKPEWEAFKSSNREEIIEAIYNNVYNEGRGPSRNSSAGSGDHWQSLFAQIQRASGDKLEYCRVNANHLISSLERCFTADDDAIKASERGVRDFVDLLARIKSDWITDSNTLSQVISTLRGQYNQGGTEAVQNFLNLTSSYGVDTVEVIQIMGPYWGRSAQSWFDRWGIPYRSFDQRATEPKMAQYERMAQVLKIRMVGNESVLLALGEQATIGHDGEISDGDDGNGIREIFEYAKNDHEFQEELQLESIRTILEGDGFAFDFNPVRVLVFFLEKIFNLRAFLRAWQQTDDWEMALNRMDVIQILGESGYNFGIRVVGGNEENHRYFSYVGYYEQMCARANAILIEGYSWWTGHSQADKMFFYNLISEAARDSFLRDALQRYQVSYPDTETHPVRWVWKKIVQNTEQEEVSYMIEHGPYFQSNIQTLRAAGIDYQRAFSVAQLKKKGEEQHNQALTTNNTEINNDIPNANFHQNSQEATELGALAFTRGKDIHFAPGQFKPNTVSGLELIGHELHHVKQQADGRVNPTTQQKGTFVNNDSHLEKEADLAGIAFASNLVNSTNQMKNESKPSFSQNENTNSSPFQLKSHEQKKLEPELTPFRI